MRHTIAFTGSNRIKNGQLSFNIQSLQDGEYVKVSEGPKHIYMVYRLSEQMNMREVVINERLLTLNGLNSSGKCVVEKCYPRGREHIKVEVSELDWKIINLNQEKIATSFLQQISIVWPKAILPIYYDQMNFVALNVLCQQISKLSINTTIEFQVIGENKQLQQVQPPQQPQIIKNQLYLSSSYKAKQNGYLNTIKVNKQLYEAVNLSSKIWIIQNDLFFKGVPKIQELINYEKKVEQVKKNQKQVQQQNLKKLVFIETSEQIQRSIYITSDQCQQVLGLSQKITISNDQQLKPNITNLTLQMFLIDENYTISIYQFLTKQSLDQNLGQSSSSKFQQICQHFLDVLLSKRQFFILQKSYPYMYQQNIYLFSIKHKKNEKINSQFHKISLLGKDNETIKRDFGNKIKAGKIIFENVSESKYLYQKYQQIAPWIKLIKKSRQTKSDQKQLIENKSLFESFYLLYAQQIEKIYKFINLQCSQKILLISSFGNNGKTLLHQYLKQNGKRMWYINFRSLNEPGLSYRQIDFYLNWIFAHSPFQLLFLDDFDSLCAKIDEGDQLKKKQKIISKLIVRKINHYLNIYHRKIIITAKNQSNLDQQLDKSITINLRNPNRQQRNKIIRKILDFKQSPIKILQGQEQQGQIISASKKSQHLLNQIVQSTQSLTFGSFIKFAISQTIPKDKQISTTYDFSKIAGLKIAKSTIKNIIQKPIKYAFLFKSVPIKLPRGILLYGATGNGKSALGAAVQDQFKMKYFSVKGSDILSKYIGGSEAAVRDIFEKALSVSPSIIFFDEFQSIVPKRSANNTGVNDRIVNQFLCYLDGVSAITGVYIIAASSRPEMIDPAVLRPGRLDAHLFLDYPTEEDREELISLFQKSIRIELEKDEIIKMTQSFSYSDLIGLFKELRIKRSSEVLKKENYQSEQFLKINAQLFHTTIKGFKLSVTPPQQKKQRQNYINFRDGVGPDVKKQKQIQF